MQSLLCLHASSWDPSSFELPWRFGVAQECTSSQEPLSCTSATFLCTGPLVLTLLEPLSPHSTQQNAKQVLSSRQLQAHTTVAYSTLARLLKHCIPSCRHRDLLVLRNPGQRCDCEQMLRISRCNADLKFHLPSRMACMSSICWSTAACLSAPGAIKTKGCTHTSRSTSTFLMGKLV